MLSTRYIAIVSLQNSRCSSIWVVALLMLFASCKGQNKSENPNSSVGSIVSNNQPPIAFGHQVIDRLSKNVGSIFQDKNGNYWFATQGEGVYRYDGESLVQFTSKDGLCGNHVSSVQQDSAGAIWFTTSEGICRLQGSDFNNFTAVLKSTAREDLHYSNSSLFFIFEGYLWQYDGKFFSKFPVHPSGYQQSSTNLDNPYGIYYLFKDNSGKLWFGTDQKGVGFYDGKSIKYVTGMGLEKAAIRAIFQDSGGTMWFGNNGYGLFRYEQGKLTNFTEQNGLGNPAFLKKTGVSGNSKNLARVWAIAEDKNKTLWIGTIDSGVWNYNGKELKNFTKQDGLANDKVSAIFKDNQGELWFVSEEESLNKFNGHSFERPEIRPK